MTAYKSKPLSAYTHKAYPEPVKDLIREECENFWYPLKGEQNNVYGIQSIMQHIFKEKQLPITKRRI